MIGRSTVSSEKRDLEAQLQFEIRPFLPKKRGLEAQLLVGKRRFLAPKTREILRG